MKKVRKVVIPVAGMGTRFLPATKAVAKELFPIVDIPVIHYIVKEAILSGIEEILFVTNSRKEAIERYFSHDAELEDFLREHGKLELLQEIDELLSSCQVSFVEQKKPLGTGDAILLARDFVGDEPFAVMYGDDLFSSEVPVLRQLIDVYGQCGNNVIGVQEVELERVHCYGVCQVDADFRVVDIVEKPSIDEAPSRMVGLGRYILNSEIFPILERIEPVNGEYLLTDAMRMLMKQRCFYYCLVQGTYYDIGSQVGYVKANLDFALQRDDFRCAIEDMFNKKE